MLAPACLVLSGRLVTKKNDVPRERRAGFFFFKKKPKSDICYRTYQYRFCAIAPAISTQVNKGSQFSMHWIPMLRMRAQSF
jgi:hypothetical protein